MFRATGIEPRLLGELPPISPREPLKNYLQNASLSRLHLGLGVEDGVHVILPRMGRVELDTIDLAAQASLSLVVLVHLPSVPEHDEGFRQCKWHAC